MGQGELQEGAGTSAVSFFFFFCSQRFLSLTSYGRSGEEGPPSVTLHALSGCCFCLVRE